MTGLEVDIGVRRDGFELALAATVAPGTTTALMGPNGSGKSTAIAVIAGLLAPTSGRVAIAGRTVDDATRGIRLDPAARCVGVVFQDLRLFPRLTVLDNIAFPTRVRTHRRRHARAQAGEWVERFGLEAVAHRRPHELSGGQAQRVALARALAADPDVLLLDEPLSALDVRVRDRARRELAEHLRDFGGATLLVTHDLADVHAIADRAVVLEHGRVTQEGDIDVLAATPATDYVERLVRGAEPA